MKIRSKLVIHPLYYVVAFICFITGYFKAFTIYTTILIVHELGHIIAGLILKWPINKVTVYPFGCMTTFDQQLNSSIIEEFFVLIYGPLFQIVFYMLYPTPYHYFILFFNLLPIYPLDGSKLLFLFFNKIMSYYHSYICIYVMSFITLFILYFIDISLLSYLILTYIFYDVIKSCYKLPYTMLKFFYERYKETYNYKKTKIIIGNNLKKMYRLKTHYFVIKNKLYHEKELLKKYFLTNKY